ncbi:hypothetical protein IM720_24325 [Pseudomonas fluorescens]|uniref:Uncharacterized protein n=1 Tax=Pseudomonas fluorescens TaxID=294 RepID=A0A7M2J2E0_PSEFL|nr:hypothetical protein [Pseudomonas fluorescens]QOU03802.1 hypothetical protein IM720_24325 [Pseudomonas fluorescens]
MPELKFIKRLLVTGIVIALCNIGVTTYGIIRNGYMSAITAKQLHSYVEHQADSLRGNWFDWQQEDLARSRRFAELEVAKQLRQLTGGTK